MTSALKKYSIVPKSEDHAKWYQSILYVSDMIDYTDVGGCYVLKPLANDLWEEIKKYLDHRIKKLDVENYYFPMFCTKTNLEKESSHFSDFTPEVAWIVTEDPVIAQREKNDPEITELLKKLKDKGIEVYPRTVKSERYAIRPTSETIIYPHFAQWIKKDGKCPKINQWANVVRWENKETTPFIRSREFLWQEGHTCHLSRDVALTEVFTVLDMYKSLYEDMLAVPMIPGIKTKSETFPGAEITMTIEGFLPDSGKGIQSATSHYLGQKFATMFNIKSPINNEFIHQNSWGLTTRSIGIMVMTHSDDRGIIIPPMIAPIQVILIACGLNSKTTDLERAEVNRTIKSFCDCLIMGGIRAKFDSEDLDETPGMKFNKWEVRGVPLRIEMGPKDILNNTVVFARRDRSAKEKDIFTFDKVDNRFILKYLDQIQSDMYIRAFDKMKQNIIICLSDEDIIRNLKEKKLILVPWKDSDDDGILETRLKELCKANGINSTKILCIPSEESLKKYGFYEGQKMALFGRSY
jgi:prolyl-tRNA synthetase